jgi:methylmalonyl-CoA mutase C-terminal domain/subunit
MTLFVRVLDLLKENGASNIVLFGGGIIPEEDRKKLLALGVGELFTPGAPTQEIVDWLSAALKVTI